jgi:hypothetical protein
METSTIQCNIHQHNYAAMDVIKQKINHAGSVCTKARFAEELSDKIVTLMNCPQYDDQKQDCQYCRMITFLNKKTAEVIINAKPLSQ